MNFPMTTFPFILLWQEQKRGKEAFTTRGQIWATSLYFWPKIWPQPHPVCVSAGRRMCTSSIAKLKGLLTVRYFKWERLEKTTKTKTSCPEHFLFNDFCICGFFKMWVSRVLDCSEPAIKNCKLNIQVRGKSELLLSFLLHPFRGKDSLLLALMCGVGTAVILYLCAFPLCLYWAVWGQVLNSGC